MPLIPSWVPFIGQDDPQPGPLVANLPTYQQQLANQFNNAQLNTLLNAYDPTVRQAYQQLQNQRVNVLGSAPTSGPIISKGIKAAGTHQAVTPEPEGNLFENFRKDVGSLTSLLNPVNLIGGLAKEAMELPHFAEKVYEGLGKSSNPLEAIGSIARAPGVRLIPGSFVAGSLAPGEKGLAGSAYEHPLFTALDVLPYASKAARLTPVVKAAEEAAQEAANLAVLHPSLLPPSTRVPAIRTLIENFRPGEAGGFVRNPEGRVLGLRAAEQTGEEAGKAGLFAPALEPNIIGQKTQALGDLLRKNKLLAGTVFGETSLPRKIARLANRSQPELTSSTRVVQHAMDEAQAWEVQKWLDDNAQEFAQMPTEDKAALMQTFEHPDIADELPAHLTPYYDDFKARIEQTKDAYRSTGEGGDVKQVGWERHGPEFYPAKIANEMNAAHEASFGLGDELDNAIRRWDSGEPPTAEELAAQGMSPKTYARLLDEGDVVLEPHPGAYEAFAPYMEQMNQHFAARDWKMVREDLMAARKAGVIPQAIDSQELMRSVTRNIRLEAQHLPSRWQPILLRRMQEGVGSLIKGEAGPYLRTGVLGDGIELGSLTPEQALAKVEMGDFSWMDKNQRSALGAHYRNGLQTLMRDAPNTPVYVPHVTPEAAMKSLNAPSTFAPLSLDALKERSMLNTPGNTTDPFLALSHSSKQIIQRRVQERLGQAVVDNFGRRWGDLSTEYLDAYGKDLEDPTGLMDAHSALKAKVAESWRPFNPKTWFDPSLEKSGLNLDADTIMVPKEVLDTINDFKNMYQAQSALGRAMNMPMKVFRTSVLTASPRFYINNVFGGGMITALNAENPLTIWKHARDAWNLSRHPEALTELRDGTLLQRSRVHNLPAQDIDTQAMVQYATELHQNKAGLLGAYQQFEAGKAMAKMGNKIQNFSQKFNAVNDGFFQALNFLEGRESGLTKGMSEAEAIQAGVESSRRAFEMWDTLTPTERTIIKSVFPFYGFTRNMLKYVLQYPSNHPTRLSILSNLAHAEQEDFGSGLPQKFANMFWLGSPQSDGKVKTISVGGMSPFQDVASYASLMGFLTGQGGDLSAITKNVNPLIGTGLKTMGIDTSAGMSDLYPEIDLNPVTGERTVTSEDNFLTNLATSIVPQASILTNLTGINSKFRAQLQNNPDAAGRTLLASLGVPAYVREVDVPTERIKAEITRTKAQKDVWNQALKSGDWDPAMAWPNLREYLEKVRKLSPEEIKKVELQEGPGSLGAALLRAGTGGAKG